MQLEPHEELSVELLVLTIDHDFLLVKGFDNTGATHALKQE